MLQKLLLVNRCILFECDFERRLVMWNSRAIKTPFGHRPPLLKNIIVLQTITWQVLRRALFPSGNKVYPNSNRVSNNTVLIWKSHFLPWLPKSLGQEEQDFYLQFWASSQNQMARIAPLHRKKEEGATHSTQFNYLIIHCLVKFPANKWSVCIIILFIILIIVSVYIYMYM